MPMMERDGKCKCVVCPVIERKAKKRAKDKRKERKRTGPTAENASSPVEVVDTATDLRTANEDNQIHISQGGDGAQDEILATKNIPANVDVSKFVQGGRLLELVEAPVGIYFVGLDATSDRLLNGWHLSGEKQGCSSCGHPMIYEENAFGHSPGEFEGVCINAKCRVVATNHSLNGSQDLNIQSNHKSYDSDDDDLFDLDDPALVAMQKLACDKKNAATASSTDNRKAPHDNCGNTLDENDAIARTRQPSAADPLATSHKNERSQSFETFTFDRRGFDACRFDSKSTEPKSVSSLGAEINCDSLSSCSSLSFSAKKSHCSKKTCTTGIVTSRSDSSDGSDDMSALVEKINKAKQRILSRVERRGGGSKNMLGRDGNSKSRNTVDYDVANLIDRLAIAAKEVEELDNCIAKAQDDQALNF